MEQLIHGMYCNQVSNCYMYIFRNLVMQSDLDLGLVTKTKNFRANLECCRI